ncbi:calcium-binding protein [Tropicibacter naphthalenivorans]|uniref:Hemolysin IA n=1 Tax=Tropicibacter naphthalenivorans TaxID=441103 RepID=A0A0P1G1A1_9RHOB|nr:calcium-binding protein [Tropicibacter naphthalenivorans]CUH75477.1 Hemolysin IA [Tropicibacter naphthalenivorans]SMC44258.1 Hemolysin-type calcium-binding repeat-containing protein [Tropicibacter naphthalenivorans]
MALTGTRLGSAGDDLLGVSGGHWRLLGRAGADTYALNFSAALGAVPQYDISESSAADDSIDRIQGLPPLAFQSTFQTGLTRFVRVGADGQHLVITTPDKGRTVYDDGFIGGTIRILNQYSAALPNARIEELKVSDAVISTTLYSFAPGDTGTAGRDIITGWRFADLLNGLAGDDYVSGGAGRDTIRGGDGADTILGEDGGDYLYGGADGDLIHGAAGVDRIWAGTGGDTLYGGDAVDILRGEDGNDALFGGAGNDILFGVWGVDSLTGGLGNDRLYGNRGRDIYSVDVTTADHDRVLDNGRGATSPKWSNFDRDVIELLGFASTQEAIHNVTFARAGDDLILTYTGPDMDPGDSGSVYIQGQFTGQLTEIELVSFGKAGGIAAYDGAPSYHLSLLKGDAFIYSQHNGGDAGGEDIVLGTTGDDEIYGGLGNDLLVGFGGADVFFFQDETDGDPGADFITDFDAADDVVDLSEIGGLSFASLTIADNAWGNAVVSSAYFTVELGGTVAADVTAELFVF